MEEDIGPENIAENKETLFLSDADQPDEFDFSQDVPGSDLDIPSLNLRTQMN